MGKRGRPKKEADKEKDEDVVLNEDGGSMEQGTAGLKQTEIAKEMPQSGPKTPIAQSINQGEAGGSSGTKALWSDQVEKEQGRVDPDLTQPVRKWSEVLIGNRDTSTGWSLVYSPPLVNTHVVNIPPEDTAEACANWRNALLGFVAGIKPRFREMEGYARVRWGAGGPTVHMLQEGVFLFDFKEDEAAKEKVMDQNWSFRGHPLILRPWTPDVDLNKLEVEKVPVWVQFPQLPLSCWSQKILGRIASFIGVPLATDQLTAKRGRLNYARVLVEMKIGTGLQYEIPVVDSGRQFMQPVVYEWRPLRCERCKRLGHDMINCTMPVQQQKQVWVAKPVAPQVTEVEEIVAEKGSEPETVVEKTTEEVPEIVAEATAPPKKQVGNQNQKKKKLPPPVNVRNSKKDNNSSAQKEKQKQTGSESVIKKMPSVGVVGNQVTVYLPPNG